MRGSAQAVSFTMSKPPYIGRFAPSPSGPLHAGSLVAAVASYLDAKAHGGRWLVRIEDVDEARTVPGSAEGILQTLVALGMQWDGEVLWQSHRTAVYEAAFKKLGRLAYPCACTRKEIADSRPDLATDGAAVYPGTCRKVLAPGRTARAFRVRVPDPGAPEERIAFTDRWAGPQAQHLASEAGDFILKRADGYWAYQLAVVVDDAAQGVTDVVRGQDLLDSSARQIYLQRLLGLPTPRTLHVPVVTDGQGRKLSKQNGAQAVEASQALSALRNAALFLDLGLSDTDQECDSVEQFWQRAIAAWAARFGPQRY
jgi:glutamyl-Q tRNA(Asp) synthetase